ncbi:hypothetical protein AB0I00_28960 [Streptomyces sp. NPDC050803]|uniref:hypothetical protein n=1 Tax=unclassified Streptomyces TaxID=2593676 RepID=UPI0034311DF7
MTTTDTRTTPETEPQDTAAPRLFGSRGRHRRPRPRKVLLAAGGLALAAGALSLVRLGPESGLGGLGAPDAEPWRAPGTGSGPGTDRSSNAAATVAAVPQVSPSATSVMGGLGATPTPAASLLVVPDTSAAPPPSAAVAPPDTTTIPEAPVTTPRPSATTSAAPRPATPAPAPSQTSDSPQPTQPGQSDPPGVCVPIIGLCVDALTARKED